MQRFAASNNTDLMITEWFYGAPEFKSFGGFNKTVWYRFNLKFNDKQLSRYIKDKFTVKLSNSKLNYLEIFALKSVDTGLFSTSEFVLLVCFTLTIAIDQPLQFSLNFQNKNLFTHDFIFDSMFNQEITVNDIHLEASKFSVNFRISDNLNFNLQNISPVKVSFYFRKLFTESSWEKLDYDENFGFKRLNGTFSPIYEITDYEMDVNFDRFCGPFVVGIGIQSIYVGSETPFSLNEF